MRPRTVPVDRLRIAAPPARGVPYAVVASTGSVLTSTPAGGIATMPLLEWARAPEQHWAIVRNDGEPGFQLVNSDGTCLHGASAVTWRICDDTDTAYRWRLAGYPRGIALRNAGNGRCLSRIPPVDVGLRPCRGTARQVWRFGTL